MFLLMTHQDALAQSEARTIVFQIDARGEISLKVTRAAITVSMALERHPSTFPPIAVFCISPPAAGAGIFLLTRKDSPERRGPVKLLGDLPAPSYQNGPRAY